MSLITGPIQPQKFELIRDRIGAILLIELAGQAVLQQDSTILSNVFINRQIPISSEELPAINVSFDGGSYANKDMLSVEGSYTYFIDIYSRSNNDNQNGDAVSVGRTHKITGIVRAILEHPAYKTMGYAPSFCNALGISQIAVANESVVEIENISKSRLTFSIRANETVMPQESRTLDLALTTVKLNETDSGYQWVYTEEFNEELQQIIESWQQP